LGTTEEAGVRYLHTMVRVSDVEKSLDFYCNKLGMREVRRTESEAGRYTLIFLAAPEDMDSASTEKAPLLELTYNWDPEVYGEGRNFGHLAFEVDDIYATCDRLAKAGVTINRPPRDGRMRSSARPTTSRSSCCRRARPSPRQSPGLRCRIRASGSLAPSRGAAGCCGVVPIAPACAAAPDPSPRSAGEVGKAVPRAG
jgi:lactoylglutathione lyase